MEHITVFCFGEVLWDLLPTRKVVGGAPLNVAFHASSFGLSAKIVSSIGDDDLGRELTTFLQEKGLDLSYLQQNKDYPTGTVTVALSGTGKPIYTIYQPVAWDFIRPEANLQRALGEDTALVYGSLASRSAVSRQTLIQLLESDRALHVFDLNLRPPFYHREIILQLMERADLVKLNDEEMHLLADWHGWPSGDLRAGARHLQETYHLKGVLTTLGAAGLMYYDGSNFFQQPGYPVKVVDTVGSGDASLAGFLVQFLRGQPLEYCLRFANACGALVAGKSGATPTLGIAEICSFIEQVK